MVHLQGFEPGTHWLRVSCSTNWAKGACLSRISLRMSIENRIKQIETRNRLKSSSPRTFSIGQLNTLLCLHLRPIKLVVCKCPYSSRMGDLILRHVSRLDAFSVYHSRTRLLSYALGRTTDAPVVRPTRSSRTKVSSSQISFAHDR